MNPQTTMQENKSGYVRARLTAAEQRRVNERAKIRGLTTSEWVRETLIDALQASPGERRLTSFIAAQTMAIRLSMEEWQAGKDLSKPDVQERIQRLATEASREFSTPTANSLPERGGAA